MSDKFTTNIGPGTVVGAMATGSNAKAEGSVMARAEMERTR